MLNVKLAYEQKKFKSQQSELCTYFITNWTHSNGNVCSANTGYKWQHCNSKLRTVITKDWLPTLTTCFNTSN